MRLLKETKVTRLGWRPALALAVEAVPAAPQWHPLLQQRVRGLLEFFWDCPVSASQNRGTVGQSCMQFCLIAEIFNLGFQKK